MTAEHWELCQGHAYIGPHVDGSHSVRANIGTSERASIWGGSFRVRNHVRVSLVQFYACDGRVEWWTNYCAHRLVYGSPPVERRRSHPHYYVH